MKAIRESIRSQCFRTIMIVLLTFLGVYSCRVHAQSFKSIKYLGLEGSFGKRSFLVNSNIAKIDKMMAGHEGGILGVVFGNEVFIGKVRVVGFFTSDNNTPYTQELFEVATLTNFYPMALKRPEQALQPFLTAGFSMDNVKFFGTYLSDQYYNKAYEPYLGKITQLNFMSGIGLEYRLPSQYDFIHLFGEFQYGTPVQSRSSKVFSSTSLEQFTSFLFGVSFGTNRSGK